MAEADPDADLVSTATVLTVADARPTAVGDRSDVAGDTGPRPKPSADPRAVPPEATFSAGRQVYPR
jgi:hypothetical protein